MYAYCVLVNTRNHWPEVAGRPILDLKHISREYESNHTTSIQALEHSIHVMRTEKKLQICFRGRFVVFFF